MGGRGLVAATLAGGGLLGLVFACGQTLAPSRNVADPDAAASADAANGDGGEPEPEEQHADEFGCGEATCKVDFQVCCTAGGGWACKSVDAGCADVPAGSVDGGDAGTKGDAAPAGSTLQCTTYNNCQSGDACCWSASTGSTCKDNCNQGEDRLCTLNVDNCGTGRSCRPISGDPLGTKVGRCESDQYGGSSGGGSSNGGWW